MTRDIILVLLAGGLTLAGTLTGVWLTARMSNAAERNRREAEDARRWQGDRRTIYAKYLSLALVMLREIDGIATFLPYDDGDKPLNEEDDELIQGDRFEYIRRWEEVLQPAKSEVQLLASPAVADLADRVSGALLNLTAEIEQRGTFTNYYPMWFQADDLLSVLRNAMRQELGVSGDLLTRRHSDDDWPWLSDRPPRSSYVGMPVPGVYLQETQIPLPGPA